MNHIRIYVSDQHGNELEIDRVIDNIGNWHIVVDVPDRAAEQPRAVVQPAIELLRRLKEWDQLPSTSDGNYWIKEIDAVLRTAGGN